MRIEDADPPPVSPQVLTVSQLTSQIQQTLASTFSSVWVCGEVSDIARPQSGHVYFTLKDTGAQIRAVMWRSAAARQRFTMEDGMEVICHGEVDVYAPRGSYQIIVRQIEPRGIGALELAFRQLQQRLAREGLFDARHKKPLPRFPRRIALVTSPTGAAIRDFLEILRRRWRSSEVLVIPVRVQGEGAAEEIAAAIRLANRIAPRPDVLVVGRGGGSPEDLWCFNEEATVRAVFASEVPVVSAVGHEIDVTLCDLVADVRALTPSEAAERVVPSVHEIESLLDTFRQRLAGLLRFRVNEMKSRLSALAQRRVLRMPWERLHDLARRLDEIEIRVHQAVRHREQTARERLFGMASRLQALSPLAVLLRGYSLTERLPDGKLVSNVSDLQAGDRMMTRFAHGRTVSLVEAILE